MLTFSDFQGSNKISNSENQRTFYDERWRGFNFANHLKLLRASAILAALAFTKLREPKIVDLGCGAGWLAGIVGLFGPTVAVDLSPSAIITASEKFKYVHFVAANILDWNHQRNIFDIVVSQEVIEHLEEQERYIEIAYGLLKENGYLILTTPNLSTMEALTEKQRASWSNQPIENLIDKKKLKAILNSKFKIIKLSSIISGYGNKGVYRIINSERLVKILKWCKLFELFDHIRLSLGFGLHILLVAKKEKGY